tara:strand:- start:22 stop:645 length:624 start_codon:yes stop_codon:yes gene_type:complete
MIISHKHKFIYFKATKVAGTSTEILLDPIAGESAVVTPISKSSIYPHQPRNYDGFDSHTPPSYVKRKEGDVFDSYFKFASIRNPFDRAVSWFYYKEQINPFPTEGKNFSEFILGGGLNGLDPHYGFLFIENKLICDDLIRYETLESDTKRILGKYIDVDCIVYPHAKSHQRKVKKHYSKYYDDKLKEIVAEKYAKDIEYFGYEFGNN